MNGISFALRQNHCIALQALFPLRILVDFTAPQKGQKAVFILLKTTGFCLIRGRGKDIYYAWLSFHISFYEAWQSTKTLVTFGESGIESAAPRF